MKYIDEVQGDIITEEEMSERLYEYINFDDLAETLRGIRFRKIWENLSETMQLEIFEETMQRVIEENLYFVEYEDDDEEE